MHALNSSSACWNLTTQWSRTGYDAALGRFFHDDDHVDDDDDVGRFSDELLIS